MRWAWASVFSARSAARSVSLAASRIWGTTSASNFSWNSPSFWFPRRMPKATAARKPAWRSAVSAMTARKTATRGLSIGQTGVWNPDPLVEGRPGSGTRSLSEASWPLPGAGWTAPVTARPAASRAARPRRARAARPRSAPSRTPSPSRRRVSLPAPGAKRTAKAAPATPPSMKEMSAVEAESSLSNMRVLPGRRVDVRADQPGWPMGRVLKFNLSAAPVEVNENSKKPRGGTCVAAGREDGRYFPGGGSMAEQATKSIIVGAGVGEVFEAWSNFENFPNFMKNIKSVEKRADGSTHWTMDGPLGKSVEWDAETTMFEPRKRIAWRSREGSTIKTSGQVTFAEMGTGQTQVNLTIQW